MIWTLFRFEITVSGQAGISVGVCRRWCSVPCTIVSSFVQGVVIPLLLLRDESWELKGFSGRERSRTGDVAIMGQTKGIWGRERGGREDTGKTDINRATWRRMRFPREAVLYTEGEEMVRENLLGHRERREKYSGEISIVHENTCNGWKAAAMER